MLLDALRCFGVGSVLPRIMIDVD